MLKMMHVLCVACVPLQNYIILFYRRKTAAAESNVNKWNEIKIYPIRWKRLTNCTNNSSTYIYTTTQSNRDSVLTKLLFYCKRYRVTVIQFHCIIFSVVSRLSNRQKLWIRIYWADSIKKRFLFKFLKIKFYKYQLE